MFFPLFIDDPDSSSLRPPISVCPYCMRLKMDNSVSQSLCSNVYVLSLSCLLELTKRVSLKPEGPDLLVDSGRLETVGTAAAPSPGAEQWQDSQTVAPLARTGATDCPLRRAGAQSANLCQPQDNSTTLKTI